MSSNVSYWLNSIRWIYLHVTCYMENIWRCGDEAAFYALSSLLSLYLYQFLDLPHLGMHSDIPKASWNYEISIHTHQLSTTTRPCKWPYKLLSTFCKSDILYWIHQITPSPSEWLCKLLIARTLYVLNPITLLGDPIEGLNVGLSLWAYPFSYQSTVVRPVLCFIDKGHHSEWLKQLPYEFWNTFMVNSSIANKVRLFLKRFFDFASLLWTYAIIVCWTR